MIKNVFHLWLIKLNFIFKSILLFAKTLFVLARKYFPSLCRKGLLLMLSYVIAIEICGLLNNIVVYFYELIIIIFFPNTYLFYTFYIFLSTQFFSKHKHRIATYFMRLGFLFMFQADKKNRTYCKIWSSYKRTAKFEFAWLAWPTKKINYSAEKFF